MTTYRCPDSPGDIVGCGKTFEGDTDLTSDDFDGMIDCPHCGICFEPEQGSPFYGFEKQDHVLVSFRHGGSVGGSISAKGESPVPHICLNSRVTIYANEVGSIKFADLERANG